ncbi:MAG: TlyA family RNA methyltransferase [Lachnospiraceae bacterium]|nr:TlyA family RNA methyltransferase [Lachnospiraceae bacterium]
MKTRLDILVTESGLAPSREKAKAVIMAGQVFVNGQREDKPGAVFDAATAAVEVRGAALPYVSRGGLKLEKALRVFPIDLKGRTCLDIGASTGGFTDCMLQNGAVRVFAVDVGYGQLDWKLRSDPRVICMEKTNFRYLMPEGLLEAAAAARKSTDAAFRDPADLSTGDPLLPDFASCDVSFISLSKILPTAFEVLQPDAEMVCLIKPQFEAGRARVGKHGVVRDPKVHEDVILDALGFANASHFEVAGLDWSPIRGPEGNIEYLMYLLKGKTAGHVLTVFGPEEVKRIVAGAHAELEQESV